MPTLVGPRILEARGKKAEGLQHEERKLGPGCGLLFLEACLGMRELGEIWGYLHIQINKTSEGK